MWDSSPSGNQCVKGKAKGKGGKGEGEGQRGQAGVGTTPNPPNLSGQRVGMAGRQVVEMNDHWCGVCVCAKGGTQREGKGR